MKTPKLTKEMIDAILYWQYEEEDYDREVGLCKTLYTISNLFHDPAFAKYAIEKIITAYMDVQGDA